MEMQAQVGGSTQFPNHFMQPVEAALLLAALCTLTAMLARRWPAFPVSVGRLSVLLVFVDAWAFVVSSTFLVLGVGTGASSSACSGTLWLCLTFYAGSKLTTSWFLIERAHLVFGGGAPRRSSRLYKCNLLILVCWIAVFFVLVFTRFSRFDPLTDSCSFTISPASSASAMALDCFSNIYLLLLFAYPLWRKECSSPALRSLAFRAIFAATVATLSSAGNLLLISVQHGTQESWLCLLMCTADVTISASAIFWVTTGVDLAKAEPPNRSAIPVPIQLGLHQSQKVYSDRIDLSPSGRWDAGIDVQGTGVAPFSSLVVGGRARSWTQEVLDDNSAGEIEVREEV